METKSDGGRKPLVNFPSGNWVCPRCKKKIKFFVPMTAPPTCRDHIGNAIVVMEKK